MIELNSVSKRYQTPEGEVRALEEVSLTIEAGECWNANVTLAAVDELAISNGAEVWVSFKSTALHIF